MIEEYEEYYPIVNYFTVAVLKTKKDIGEYFDIEKRRTDTRKEFGAKSRQLFSDLVVRDGPTCKHCGTSQNLTIDHIFPVYWGGTNSMDNLQLLCKSCNSKKGTR
jgi:5-methylcytosine-specific restriction endonuclease McrA